MSKSIEVGKTYSYVPQAQAADDNLHWPAEVLEVKKRVKVRLLKEGAPKGEVVWVSAKQLHEHGDLFGAPA